MTNTTTNVIKSVMSPRWKQIRLVLMSNDPLRYVLVGLRDDGTMWYKWLNIAQDEIENMAKMSCTEMFDWIEVKLINTAHALDEFANTVSPYAEHPITDDDFELGIRSSNGIIIKNTKVDGALRLTLNGVGE